MAQGCHYPFARQRGDRAALAAARGGGSRVGSGSEGLVAHGKGWFRLGPGEGMVYLRPRVAGLPLAKGRVSGGGIEPLGLRAAWAAIAPIRSRDALLLVFCATVNSWHST